MTKQDKLKALTFAARVRSHATDVEAMNAKLRSAQTWAQNRGIVPAEELANVAELFDLIQTELRITCRELREFGGDIA
jgi:hypothetical protein